MPTPKLRSGDRVGGGKINRTLIIPTLGLFQVSIVLETPIAMGSDGTEWGKGRSWV